MFTIRRNRLRPLPRPLERCVDSLSFARFNVSWIGIIFSVLSMNFMDCDDRFVA